MEESIDVTTLNQQLAQELFIVAAGEGDLESVMALSQHPDVDIEFSNALAERLAVKHGHENIVRWLRKKKKD